MSVFYNYYNLTYIENMKETKKVLVVLNWKSQTTNTKFYKWYDVFVRDKIKTC